MKNELSSINTGKTADVPAICLIRPPAVESFRFATTSTTLPLGLAYIAAALEKHKRKVTVVDAVGEAPDNRTRYYKGYLLGLDLGEIVARIPPETALVGITVVFTHEWPVVVQLVELIKAARPDLTVVLGGEHISSMPEFSLMTSKADILVMGEGEEIIIDLVDALESGRELSGIEGIAYRDGAKIIINRRRARKTDIDSIPFPAWHHFKVKTYHENRFVGGMYSSSLTIPILGTRGCPYQCTYCSAPNMWTPQWIPRDPVKVVDEIQHYVETYGARNFPFQDLTAIIRKDWIVTFCREIIKRDLKIAWQFPTGTRAEAVDPEVAGLLRESGMISMAYAPESASEVTRQFIKKKMKTDGLFDSIRAATDAKLNVIIFLVIGFPHDITERILENMPYLDRFAKEGVTDVSVGFYMALPGTQLFYSLYDAGKIRLNRDYFRHILDSLSLWPSQSYCSLSRLELAVLKLRIFLGFYGAKRQLSGRGALMTSVKRALSGFGKGQHESKLQTAFRNGMTSAWDCMRVQFKPGWMPRKQEFEMFENWDAIFESIRRQKRAGGVYAAAPADTSQLHLVNVIPLVRQDHGASRIFSIPDLAIKA